MAYFSNGSEGMCFEDQCAKCKWGKKTCPITCSLWKTFKGDLEIDPNQLSLF
jgi:hypothetical protein